VYSVTKLETINVCVSQIDSEYGNRRTNDERALMVIADRPDIGGGLCDGASLLQGESSSPVVVISIVCCTMLLFRLVVYIVFNTKIIEIFWSVQVANVSPNAGDRYDT
jgi:hypothetical protein